MCNSFFTIIAIQSLAYDIMLSFSNHIVNEKPLTIHESLEGSPVGGVGVCGGTLTYTM